MKKQISGAVSAIIFLLLLSSGIFVDFIKFMLWLFKLQYSAPETSLAAGIGVRVLTFLVSYSLVGFIFKSIGLFDSKLMSLVYFVISTLLGFLLAYIVWIIETYIIVVGIILSIILLIIFLLLIKNRKGDVDMDLLSKTIGASHLYFQTLKNINKNLIYLCALEAGELPDKLNEILYEITTNIPRIMPIKYVDNKLVTVEDDGLLRFKKTLPDLNEKFKTVIKENYDLLESVWQTRNKFQHSMHDVFVLQSFSGTDTPLEFIVEVRDKEFEFTVPDLISLVQDLNTVFAETITSIGVQAKNKKMECSSFLRKLLTFDFNALNDIMSLEFIKIKILGRTLLSL